MTGESFSMKNGFTGKRSIIGANIDMNILHGDMHWNKLLSVIMLCHNV